MALTERQRAFESKRCIEVFKHAVPHLRKLVVQALEGNMDPRRMACFVLGGPSSGGYTDLEIKIVDRAQLRDVLSLHERIARDTLAAEMPSNYLPALVQTPHYRRLLVVGFDPYHKEFKQPPSVLS